MNGDLDAIRQRIDIVELVSNYGIKLVRSGKVLKGLCPFHSDKNPSLTVDPGLGRYKCWSCGEGGDVFTWTMKTRNVEFVEAIRLLAAQAGVKLSAESNPERAVQTEKRKSLVQIMEVAQEYFVHHLLNAPAILEYCETRGLDADVRSNWGLGFAPSGNQTLGNFLSKRNISLSDSESLFLIEGSEKNNRDKFWNRLMFPIQDETGRLVAFGGRVVGDGNPKYINSSDTPLYRKSRVLYGLWQSRQELQKNRRGILCEGYIDVIACHRAGLGTAFASLGTALSEEQGKLIKRWCDEITILYDGDEPGQKATERAIEILKPFDILTKVAQLPVSKDPDDILKSEGKERLHHFITTATSASAFVISRAEKNLGTDSAVFWTKLPEMIAGESSGLERTRLIDLYAGKYPNVGQLSDARSALRQDVDRFLPKRNLASMARPVIQVGKSHTPGQILAFFRFYLDGIGRKTLHDLLGSNPGLFGHQAADNAAINLLSTFPVPPEGEGLNWLSSLEPATIEIFEHSKNAQIGRLDEAALHELTSRLRRSYLSRKLNEKIEVGALQLHQIQETLSDLKQN